jgi:hypothetical protein
VGCRRLFKARQVARNAITPPPHPETLVGETGVSQKGATMIRLDVYIRLAATLTVAALVLGGFHLPTLL